MTSVATRVLLRSALRARPSHPLLLRGGGSASPAAASLADPSVLAIWGGSDGGGVRRFGRKAARMGHHLEKADELAHRGSRADAKEKRGKKKGRKGSDESGGGATPSPTGEDAVPEMEEDESEAKFDGGEDDEGASLPDPDDVRARMRKVIAAMEESFRAVRGAEPTPELFESIQVEAYGSRAPLSSVAQVVIVGPNRATLTCYDPGTADDVRDAVRDAGMNFNPQVEEGGVVVVPIPKVSMETRERLARQIGKAAESGRQRVRRIRRAAQDVVKMGKDGKLSGVGEDEAFRAGKDIDAVTEEAIATLNEVVEKKQEAIMAV
uniref:Ribosome recycling factor domain-containing protein n=1 Tax=Odontella aurita TaxID=265563 RepID=A0A7S4NF79_9STRA|mmetsp:Transcript_60631/g.179776  ORF Transcript_60631/g.179776 Transcript_60631/m.179776 type:complete len:322 (+) Transcript_60631:283-1248(+)